MGREAVGTATFSFAAGGKAINGKILLETDEILFRGATRETRIAIRLRDITEVSAKNGILSITSPEGNAKYELGKDAEAWAKKISSPPSLTEKLGIKAGTLVAVRGKLDAAVESALVAAAETVGSGATFEKKAGVVVFAAEQASDLDTVSAIRARLLPDAALWVVYPKARKEITEAGVLAAGRAAGLKDTKVARVSETHTGLRFVVPKSER